MVEVIGVGGVWTGGGWCVGGGCAGEGRAGEGRAGEGRAGEGRADECVGAYSCFGESCLSGKDPVVEGVVSGQSSTAVDASDPTDAGVAGTLGVAGSLDPPLPSTERFDSPGAAKRNPGL